MPPSSVLPMTWTGKKKAGGLLIVPTRSPPRVLALTLGLRQELYSVTSSGLDFRSIGPCRELQET